MNRQCNPNIDKIENESAQYEHCPDFAYLESAVLAEFVVKRSRDVLERDYLFLGKSSYCDLEDGDTAVTDERKTDDEISKWNLEVDRVEGNEESQSA